MGIIRKRRGGSGGAPVTIQPRVSPELARQWRIAVIVSMFNPTITRTLLDGALRTLTRAGIPRARIEVLRVPGAFELPAAAALAAERLPGAPAQRPDAIVALGSVIRGQTPQYEAIGHAVAQGLAQVSVEAKLPVTFGVIIAETAEQAKARAGGRFGNRGVEAANAALAMLSLFARTPAR